METRITCIPDVIICSVSGMNYVVVCVPIIIIMYAVY